MKKNLLFVLSLFVSFTAFAQSAKVSLKEEIKNQAHMNVPVIAPSLEITSSTSVPPADNIIARSSDFAGQSFYDLQTNATMPNRVAYMGDGDVFTSWTFSSTDPAAGAPERGSAIRQADGYVWTDAEPNARVEDQRCGWPATNVTAGGKVVNTSHTSGPPYLINVATRDVDGGDWTSKTIPTNTPFGALWPRSAVGGDDGNTVHAIAISTPSNAAFGGAVYEGVDGHVLYYRSQDQGETWDVIDFIIPGLDSTKYASHDLDQYSISANGNTVAVALYSTWNDLKMFKSTDNGDTWETSTIIDFPLKKYAIDEGYSIDQLPEDPNRPVDDSLAIFTNDGTGEVVVDDLGNVHLTFSETYVSDQDLTDASWSFYPGYDGVYYWNESMGDNSYLYVAGAQDMDGDSILGVDNLVNYGGSSVSTHPEFAYDDEGNYYITYASYNELFMSDTQLGVRHIFLTSSNDGGMTWSEEPRNIVEEDENMQDFAAINYEFFYPALANKADNYVHLLVQIDDYPGSYVQSLGGGPTDDISGDFNYLYYANIQADLENSNNDIDISSNVNVFPNPSDDRIIVKTDFDFDNAQISLFNTIGQKVFTQRLNNVSGVNYFPIDVSSLATGNYHLNIVTENAQHAQTVIIK